MGWISQRNMRSGGSIGPGGLKAHKKGAPLRRIVATVRSSESIFQPARVELECGHEAESWGGVRARCVACKVTRKDSGKLVESSQVEFDGEMRRGEPAATAANACEAALCGDGPRRKR